MRAAHRAALGLAAVLAVSVPMAAPAAATARQGSVGVTVETLLTVAGPDVVTAGTVAGLSVSGVPAGTPVSLTVITSVGAVVLSSPVVARPDHDAAPFTLPPEITRASGTVTLIAESPGAMGTGSLVVTPGDPVGPTQPIVGPRSIIANGVDHTMAVGLPVDAYGNAIADGSMVTFRHRTPVGDITTGTAAMAHLLSWLNLPSQTVAGRGNVWVEAGATAATGTAQVVTGQQVSLDEVAGPPLPFTITAVDPGLPGRLGADGQTLVTVRTSVLADQFGNAEPDGTLVTLEWVGPEGAGRSSALTISGVAELDLQAPALPGTVTVSALCRGTDSAADLPLIFPGVVTGFPLTTADTDHGLAVTVGPVNRAGGTFVPDGSVAAVTLSDGTGHTVTAAAGVVDGEVTLVLPDAALTGPVTVSAQVLGTTQSIEAR